MKSVFGVFAFFLFMALPTKTWAQGFIDTTTGDVEEGDEFYGMDASDANTSEAQRLINQFKQGRLSSNRDRNSRFSGTLEFHDSNHDGVVDHDVDPGSGGLEGELRGLVEGEGNHLDEIAANALKEQNKGTCDGEEYGKKNKDGNRTTCHNMSGIIVDTGASHGGDEEGFHRTYKLSNDAREIAERIGRQYGERALEDIMNLYQETYGDRLGGQDRVAAVDLKRSEAAWLEQQKETIYDRQWRLLRAARLAGYDGADQRVAGTRGAVFMHELESKLANGASEQELASIIAEEQGVRSADLGYENGKWIPLSAASDPTKAASDAQAELENLPGYDPDKPAVATVAGLGRLGLDKSEIEEIADEVRQENEASLTSAQRQQQQEDAEKIAGCMEANTWCHTENSAAIATNDPNNPVEKYSEVRGDPGSVFEDTRELIAQKMAEIQTLPVNEIRNSLREISLDFNEQTHPEYFQELDQKIAEVQGLEDADPDNYNLDTMSFRELTGIRKGLNDTFDDDLSGSGLRELASEAGNFGPGTAAGGGAIGGSGNTGAADGRRTLSSVY